MDGISADFPAKADIGVDGIGHEKIALEHHANAAAQDIVVQAAQGYPGEQDLSLIRVVEALQQAKHRGFTAARGADDPQGTAGLYGEVQRPKIGMHLIIGKPDIPKTDCALVLLHGRWHRGELHRCGENLFHAAGAGRTLGVEGEDSGDHQQRIQNNGEIA